MRLLLLLLFASSSLLSAQDFRIGFVGGTALTSNYKASTDVFPGNEFGPPDIFTAASGPRSFIGGLTLEAFINGRFSIEGNALHRDLYAEIIDITNPGTPAASTTTHRFIASTTWEFPLLFKYTMGGNRWRPFVDGGVSFRSLERTGSPGPSRHGWTGGAGLAIDFGRFEIAPQLRYTRWAQGESNGFYDVKRDQLEFLTSISYRLSSVTEVGGGRIKVGLLAGLRATETLREANYRLDRREFGGVSVDVNLQQRLSLEADGIYEPIGEGGDSVLTWQFPVLLKHYWGEGGTRFFAEAGPSFRASGNLQDVTRPSHFGVTAGAGVEKRVKRVLVAPALRYTRWVGYQGHLEFGSGPLYDPNSVELVIGLSAY